MMIPLLWSSLTATEAKPSALSLGVVAAFAFCCGAFVWWLLHGDSAVEREARRLRGQVRDLAARAIEAEAKVAEYVMRDAEDHARDERIWRNVRRELHNINREGGIAMELAAENDAEAAEAVCALWLTNPPEGEKPE